MTTRAWVTEFAKGAQAPGNTPISAAQDDGPVSGDTGNTVENVIADVTTHQEITFSGSTRLIRITADGIISYTIGTAPTATTSHRRLASGQVEYVGVKPGHKISIVANT